MIEKTCCVVDHGLFVELALRLSRDFSRVLYHTPWSRGFPVLNDCIIGDGFDEIERCDDIFDHLNEIDLFVFPDIQDSGLQLHLEEMGKPVWGSRKGDSLELGRTKFLETLRDLNLPVPGYMNVRGMAELRKVLKDRHDKYIKLSRFRGSMETWHHVNYALSEPMLDSLALRFGAAQNHVPFLVCDPVETDLEVGYDGYCVDGEFPKLAVQGYEVKDKAYIASVQKYEDLPKEITIINEAFRPILRGFRYRNFLSTEIRVKDGQSFFIDPCCRCPSPATEAQLELYENLGEIIWNGSQGVLSEPELTGQFAVEAMIYHTDDAEHWRTLEIPDPVRQWVKLHKVCKMDGRYHIPPMEPHHEEIGAVVGIGDTIEDAIEHLKTVAEALKDQPVSIKTDALYDAIKEVHSAEEKGIEFTEEQVPEPEIVMKET